jgi:hypothetical protein
MAPSQEGTRSGGGRVWGVGIAAEPEWVTRIVYRGARAFAAIVYIADRLARVHPADAEG